jgi:hypothetical protein
MKRENNRKKYNHKVSELRDPYLKDDQKNERTNGEEEAGEQVDDDGTHNSIYAMDEKEAKFLPVTSLST